MLSRKKRFSKFPNTFLVSIIKANHAPLYFKWVYNSTYKSLVVSTTIPDLMEYLFDVHVKYEHEYFEKKRRFRIRVEVAACAYFVAMLLVLYFYFAMYYCCFLFSIIHFCCCIAVIKLFYSFESENFEILLYVIRYIVCLSFMMCVCVNVTLFA